MNRTLSIGLAGFSFIIEEHAYIKLSDYLSALRNSLDASEADEVMHDIEIRMVEIFKESLGKREVINDSDVDKMISQIGKPEQIEEQEEAFYSEKNTRSKATTFSATAQKQLFRDPARANLGGVCAGLAHYTGLDLRLIRGFLVGIIVLDIFFTFAISTSLLILAYIILWIILPKAETASDFLKMEGKPANFDNLKEQSTKIVQFANESTQKVGEFYNTNLPHINRAGNNLGRILRFVFGSLFALCAILSVMGVFAVFGIFGTNEINGMNELDFLFEDEMNWALKAMIILGTLLPVLLFSLLAVKLLSPKTKVRNVGYVLGGIFLALLSLSVFFGISMAKKQMIYKGHNEDTENMAITTTNDSVLIDVKKIVIPQKFTAYDSDLFSDKKLVYQSDDYPDIEVTRRADVKMPYLVVKKQADGYNIPINLSVPVEIIGNKVLLPNFIEYSYDHRFRDYEVDYEMVVPQTTKVIALNKEKISLFGDTDGDGKNDYEGSASDETSKITINGKTWDVRKSGAEDSIIINNKSYSEEEAKRLFDSLKVDFKDFHKLKKFKINLENGKPEITINTK